MRLLNHVCSALLSSPLFINQDRTFDNDQFPSLEFLQIEFDRNMGYVARSWIVPMVGCEYNI